MSYPFSMTIQDMIKDLERHGLTLAEIARRIHVHAPALSMAKAGKRSDMMYSSGKRLEALYREVCGGVRD